MTYTSFRHKKCLLFPQKGWQTYNRHRSLLTTALATKNDEIGDLWPERVSEESRRWTMWNRSSTDTPKITGPHSVSMTTTTAVYSRASLCVTTSTSNPGSLSHFVKAACTKICGSIFSQFRFKFKSFRTLTGLTLVLSHPKTMFDQTLKVPRFLFPYSIYWWEKFSENWSFCQGWHIFSFWESSEQLCFP